MPPRPAAARFASIRARREVTPAVVVEEEEEEEEEQEEEEVDEKEIPPVFVHGTGGWDRGTRRPFLG